MQPLHGVHDQQKLHQLIESLDTDGWQGAPLVIWSVYGDLLTGSHRYAAARALGWDEYDIPTIDIADVFAEADLDFDAVLEEHGNPHWQEDEFLRVLDELPAEIFHKYGIDMH